MAKYHLWTLIVRVATAIWPLVTLLIGIFIGAYLTQRNQRKQWIADRKVQEYRELVTAMTHAFNSMLHQAEPIRAYGPEEQRAFVETEEEVLVIISDRLFIAKEVEELKIMDRWLAMRREFRELHLRKQFGASLAAIKYDLIDAARKLMR